MDCERVGVGFRLYLSDLIYVPAVAAVKKKDICALFSIAFTVAIGIIKWYQT